MALSSIYSVDQWVQETKVASPPSSDRSDVPVDLPWVLYKNCLSLLSDLVPYVAAFYPSQPNEDLAGFNDDLGCLYLWGEGLEYGQLNDVFLASEDLRNTSLEILASFADTLTDQLFSRIAISTKIEDDVSILQQILDIRKGAHDARRILHGAPSINREDLELLPNVMEDAGDVDADATAEPIDEILEQIHCYVKCLMNLLPSIERSLRQITNAERSHHGTAPGEFQVSRPAEIYVRNVRDRFASANSELTERLGEANWQRHQRIRSLLNAPVIPVEDAAPKSVFKPISEFQDSALGSSIPTRSSYAATMASHTSFASTFSEKESGTLRVPPTPMEVLQGMPFDCEMCGKRLTDVRSRIDWKLHVFEDLQPYICTFSECEDSLITFPTRKLWGDHEFTRHRVDKSWNCLQCSESLKSPNEWKNHCSSAHGTVFPESQLLLFLKIAEKHMPQHIDHQQCPLCLAFPGGSQRNFISHVGKHMESIALAALPRDEDSGSECGSTTSKHLKNTGSDTLDSWAQNLANYSGFFESSTDENESPEEQREIHSEILEASKKTSLPRGESNVPTPNSPRMSVPEINVEFAPIRLGLLFPTPSLDRGASRPLLKDTWRRIKPKPDSYKDLNALDGHLPPSSSIIEDELTESSIRLPTSAKHRIPLGMAGNELPEIYMCDGNPISDEPEEIKGRGARELPRVKYDDGLTEEQWHNAVNDDEDSPEAAAAWKAPRKARWTLKKFIREGQFDGKLEDTPPGSRENTEKPEPVLKGPKDYILDIVDLSSQVSGEASYASGKHPAAFQCHLCPKRFTRDCNLRSHLRAHMDERPFVCTVCEKGFALQHDQERHERLHSAAKIFICKGDLRAGGQWGCGRRFARHEALAQHLVSRAGSICIARLLYQDTDHMNNFVSDSFMKSEQTDSSQEILKPEVSHTAGDKGGETVYFSRRPPSLLLQYPQMHEYGPSNIPQPAPVTQNEDGSATETPSNNLM